MEKEEIMQPIKSYADRRSGEGTIERKRQDEILAYLEQNDRQGAVLLRKMFEAEEGFKRHVVRRSEKR